MKVNIFSDEWKVILDNTNGGCGIFDTKKIHIGKDEPDKDDILAHEVFELLSIHLGVHYTRPNARPYIILTHVELNTLSDCLKRFYMNKDNMKVMRELSKI